MSPCSPIHRTTWSLPSRERGLKFIIAETMLDEPWSLPSRERGLKLALLNDGPYRHGSLPSRERGLKLMGNGMWAKGHSVAPFTGAWIEMPISTSQ